MQRLVAAILGPVAVTNDQAALDGAGAFEGADGGRQVAAALAQKAGVGVAAGLLPPRLGVVGPGPTQAGFDGGGGLARGEAALKLVRRDHDSHGRSLSAPGYDVAARSRRREAGAMGRRSRARDRAAASAVAASSGAVPAPEQRSS